MTAVSPSEVIIGLDVGTTAVKAVAFGLGSSWRRVVIREYALLEPAPDEAVQDPDAILQQCAAALAECVAAVGGAETIAVSLSAGMHGLLALDADLRPLTPLVTWADGRARQEAGALRRSGQSAELHRRTGVPVHPMTPLTKLLWFARHEPETWVAARWWVGLKDYVVWWLTRTLATELSSASGTGLLDVSTRTWSTEALDISGVSVDRLPHILPTTGTLPLAEPAASALGLPAGTPVVVGAGDGPLGNLGTGATAPGVAGLSLGTSGAIRTAVNTPHVDEAGALFCFALTDSVWIVGGAISNGGGVVRWLGRSMLPDLGATADDGSDDSEDAVLELAASVAPGSEGVVMLPYLLPERAPAWNPDLRGAYLGLRREHGRAHLVRAAVEGVCLQMRLVLDSLDAVELVTSIRATGGALRSALWREVLAATLDRPLHVMGDAEGTALGAAALGVFALGRAPTLDDAVAAVSRSEDPPPAVEVPADLVETYARVRASLPGLLGPLHSVASAYEGPDGEVSA